MFVRVTKDLRVVSEVIREAHRRGRQDSCTDEKGDREQVDHHFCRIASASDQAQPRRVDVYLSDYNGNGTGIWGGH